jgi:hypothetical protein
MKDNLQEQLFTELTSEEAAVIEGGKRITLHRIKCLEANADGWLNSDDVFIKLDNDRVWGPRSMDDGHEIDLQGIGKNFGRSIKVTLRDQDPGNPDDPLGSFDAKRVGRNQNAIVSGSGSRYQVFYSVT